MHGACRGRLTRAGSWLAAVLLLLWGGLAQADTRQQPPPSPTEINSATQAELEMVIGVGPELSAQILAARQSRSFRDWPDLIARLKGVGKVRASRLSAEGLRVNGESYPARPGSGVGAAPAQASAP